MTTTNLDAPNTPPIMFPPISGTALGPLSAPATGAASVPAGQLTGQAIAASTVLGWVPIDLMVTSQLTLDQLLAVIRQRLAQLEAMQVLTAAEVAETHRRIDGRQNGKPMPPRRRSAENGTPGPAPLTVAAILHQAIGTTSTTQDFNLFDAFLDLAASLLGGAGGFLVGGPGGAVIGSMIAHEWMVHQTEEGFLHA
jgi:hypothetical protein